MSNENKFPLKENRVRLRVRAPATNAPGGLTHLTVLKDPNILELHTKEHTVPPQQDCEEPGNPATPAMPGLPGLPGLPGIGGIGGLPGLGGLGGLGGVGAG